jgi:hypothetical protein
MADPLVKEPRVQRSERLNSRISAEQAPRGAATDIGGDIYWPPLSDSTRILSLTFPQQLLDSAVKYN